MIQESPMRSLLKAISWRFFGTMATMLITFLFTHKIDIAFYVGLFEFVSKVGFFYLHERLWNLVRFGAIRQA